MLLYCRSAIMLANGQKMKPKSSAGVVAYGASLLAGTLVLAELIFIFFPKIQPLGDILELFSLLMERINPAWKDIVGDGVLQRSTLALGLAWIASYAAIEYFSIKSDGLSLWRNIAHDLCGLVRLGVQKSVCATTKWLLTLLGSPILVLWSMLLRIRTGTNSVTVGFITIQPDVVLTYIKHLLLGLAILVSVALFLIEHAAN